MFSRCFIALLLCIPLFAQPKSPQSSSGADPQQNHNPSKDNQYEPTAPKPLDLNSANKGASHATYPNQDADSNRKVADYTEALAHYTLALVAVGVIQFIALFIQAVFLSRALNETRTATGLTRDSLAEVERANREQESLTKRSIDEAVRANSETEILTRESNSATVTATKLAWESFIASHRPRLIVRFVATVSDVGQPGEGISGDLLVFNTGGTTAFLQRCYSEVIFGDSLPMRSKPYLEGPSETLGEIKPLLPGQSAILKFPTDGPKALDVDERINIRRRQEDAIANPRGGANLPWHNLFLIGWIGYIDESKRTRRAGYCRKYNFTTKRFVVEADPDYEYED